MDYRDSTDDEEVRLLPHRRGADEPDPPGSDIRDGPNTSDTQRDECLLRTVGPVGPVGPDGTLSPFHSDPAGPDGQYG